MIKSTQLELYISTFGFKIILHIHIGGIGLKNEDFYKNLLDTVEDGIYYVDTNRKLTFWNRGAEIITGFSAAEVVGSYCYDNILSHVDDDGNKLCLGGCPLQKTLEDHTNRAASVYLHHKNGHRVSVSVKVIPIIENGTVVGAVETFTDNSKEALIMKDIEQLKILANQDQLTELPNRRYTESFLKSRMDEFHSLGIPFGVIFMDIDHFKRFNDDYGHDIGDEVLKMVSKVYRGAKRSQDIIGRWGGEEFIGVFSDVNMDQLSTISERIRMLVENSSVRGHGEELSVTISLGATLVREGDSIENIVKRADSLLYESKHNGRNRATLD